MSDLSQDNYVELNNNHGVKYWIILRTSLLLKSLKSKVKQCKLWWWSLRTLEQHLKREAKGFTVKSERPLQLYKRYRKSEFVAGEFRGKDIYAVIEVYADVIELIFSISDVPRYRLQKNISAYETDGKLDLDKLRRDLGYFWFVPTLYKSEICGSEAPATDEATSCGLPN